MEKLLPQNIDAEQGVLGSLLIDPMAFDLIADALMANDFYRDAHRIMYDAMISLVTRRTIPDFITLCDELERVGKLEDVGGASYVTSLVNRVPTSGNVEYYARIVAHRAQLRRLIHAAGQIAALAYECDEQALEKAEQLLYQLGQRASTESFFAMPELVSEYLEELEYLHEHRGTFTGVPTGYIDLDRVTSGLQRSDLLLLGGRPGSGKTSLGLCIGYNAALHGKSVAIFSLEMGRKQLMRRMTSMTSKIDMQRLRSGWIDDDEWSVLVEKMGNLSELPIYINDTAGNPISSMRSQLRRLIQTHGAIDLVIVDYLGLIAPEDAKEENRVQEVSKISRGLKLLAREFDLPVLALAQLSRKVEERRDKRPMLSDLRDSGSLEQDSDVVMFIYRDDYYRQGEEGYMPTNIAEVNIAKHRNGPTGTVSLFFQADQTMFYSLEDQG